MKPRGLDARHRVGAGPVGLGEQGVHRRHVAAKTVAQQRPDVAEQDARLREVGISATSARRSCMVTRVARLAKFDGGGESRTPQVDAHPAAHDDGARGLTQSNIDGGRP